MKVRSSIIKLFLLFTFVFTSCHSQDSVKKDPCTHFQGQAMTMPYHVIVGKILLPKEKKEIATLIDRTFQQIDAIFNPWNPNSEIAYLNAAASNQFYPVSKELWDTLLFCNHLFELSQGRFDPTVGTLTQEWAWQPSSQEQRSVGWRHVTLSNHRFQKDSPLTKLDLCAIAKGLCVDWIAERLSAKNMTDFFIEWAGKIRVQGHQPSNQEWQVRVDPRFHLDGHEIAPIHLLNQAVATTAECLSPKGEITDHKGAVHYYYHIIDPRHATFLEKSDSSIASVTVIAPSCALANALATAAMVFPKRQEAMNWAKEVIQLYPDVSFWILAYDIKPTNLSR